MLVSNWLNGWNYYRGDAVKQTLFKKPIQDTIRVQELNHKREKNQREREAFRKAQEVEYKKWLEVRK